MTKTRLSPLSSQMPAIHCLMPPPSSPRSRCGASSRRVRLASRMASKAMARRARVELVHQQRSEAVKNPLIAPAANDQDLGHERGIAHRKCLDGIHESRGSLAQRFDLSL